MPRISTIIFISALCIGLYQGKTCTPNPTAATTLTSSISGVNGAFDFDDLGYTDGYGWRSNDDPTATVYNKTGLVVTSSGSTCIIYNEGFNMGSAVWQGASNWNGESSKPGYYMGVDAAGGYCGLSFSAGIRRFSMRVNTYSPPVATVHIFDTNGAEISCSEVAVTAGTNTWSIIGFDSSAFIGSVQIWTNYAVIDKFEFYGCGFGFEYNGQECIDINECDSSPCDSLATCDNTDGSFTCTCPSGYTGDGIGADSCADINECDNDPCYSTASCTNTNGSFVCSCPDGFSGDGIGVDGCDDVNECSESQPCSLVALCTNLEGSFNCTCNSGYIGDGIGANGCNDINECDYDPCGTNTVCTNTAGSFTCACKNGYEGDASVACTLIQVVAPSSEPVTPLVTPPSAEPIGAAPIASPIATPIASPIPTKARPGRVSNSIQLKVVVLLNAVALFIALL